MSIGRRAIGAMLVYNQKDLSTAYRLPAYPVQNATTIIHTELFKGNNTQIKLIPYISCKQLIFYYILSFYVIDGK